jgi:hypothetical protein
MSGMRAVSARADVHGADLALSGQSHVPWVPKPSPRSNVITGAGRTLRRKNVLAIWQAVHSQVYYVSEICMSLAGLRLEGS